MTQRLNYFDAAPLGYKALFGVKSYLESCGLEAELIDLVYLRVSQINGCAFCISQHSRDLIKLGVSLDKVLLVPVWREGGALFDRRECAALAWAESVTLVHETEVPDADFQAAAAVFGEKELADLTLAIALMNALNRVGVGFRLVPASVRQHEDASSDQ
ncbi:carboxymuconolactone decarboxylase family protein [Pseudomonas gingeri]|uniref:carboxymuconolactone decarboxylase family protein n=1 Tax=Pseudomonas gingeri TaxID=117681 RepID=UPI0015A28857|nr:carboxymuconolactone decarboxylase family protein [Pseudomonas gingeri]NWD77422.1 carboxymuconolactone decarboxylase family protein [Pseudomonas gingeri]